jgi:hypothetical protein
MAQGHPIIMPVKLSNPMPTAMTFRPRLGTFYRYYQLSLLIEFRFENSDIRAISISFIIYR